MPAAQKISPADQFKGHFVAPNKSTLVDLDGFAGQVLLSIGRKSAHKSPAKTNDATKTAHSYKLSNLFRSGLAIQPCRDIVTGPQGWLAARHSLCECREACCFHLGSSL